jgi:hypothetical protein
MKPSMIGAAAASLAATAGAQNVDFNGDAPGVLPCGWTCGVTGRGSPKWAVALTEEFQ